MTTFRLRATALILLVSTSLSGCGFLFTKRPPAGHENMDSFSCTQSKTGPLLDIIGASISAVVVLGIIVNKEEVPNEGEAIAFWTGVGIVSGLSARSGYGKTAECREARQRLAEREAMGQGRNAANAPGYGAVQAVSITPQTATIRVGETLMLTAVARGADGQPLATRLFRWTSSNDAIASVSGEGVVRAYAAGTVVIAANSNNLVGTMNLLVRLNPSR